MKPIYRPIPSDASKLFKTGVYKTAEEFEHPWHYHSEFELTYILGGQGIRYVGNSIENFSEDDLVLVGSNLPHCWANTYDSPEKPSSLVLYLNEEFLDKTWIESWEFDTIRNLLSLANKGIKFDRTVALQVKDKCLELLSLSSIDRLICLLQILKELAKTTEFHYLCEQGFTYELNPTHNERINTVYKYIEKHYKNKISLASVAAEVNMSEEYFSRFFSKIMRKSFFEFLNEYKINKACKLLIETDKQVSEICYASGFQSIPFFYRQFKKVKNCQPKCFRANFQKLADQ